MNVINRFTSKHAISAVLAIGLLLIVLLCLYQQLPLALVVAILPFVGLQFIRILQAPIQLFYTLFTINFFIIGVARYVPIPLISVIAISTELLLFVLLFIHSALYKNVPWRQSRNILTALTLVWAIYGTMQIINPTAHFESWVLSITVVYTGLFISVLTTVLISHLSQLRTLMLLLAFFCLLGTLKAIWQKYVGFDAAEWRWLYAGAEKTHIIQSGIRYFSFFSDAGNMGSNMGGFAILFGLLSLYVRSMKERVFYIVVSLLALFAMFLSGTRGAIIVPLAGVAAFAVLSKQIRLMIIGGGSLLAIYIFFAFTTIGQDNPQIRRMRTAFRPSADASFNVRKINQQRLAMYLKDKPFGEGLGLSGVENQVRSNRFTTNIPNDSWYVKVWVETGIVGLIMYLAMLLLTFFRATYMILFQIRNKELSGYLIALLSCVFGLSVSAYGNPFWGQFPTHILVFFYMGVLMNGLVLQRNLEQQKV